MCLITIVGWLEEMLRCWLGEGVWSSEFNTPSWTGNSFSQCPCFSCVSRKLVSPKPSRVCCLSCLMSWCIQLGSFFIIISLTWRYFNGMCLVFEWKIGSWVRQITLWMSIYIMLGFLYSSSSSLSSALSQAISFFDAVMYSASHDDCATSVCFLRTYLTSSPLIIRYPPVIDLLSSFELAQDASL